MNSVQHRAEQAISFTVRVKKGIHGIIESDFYMLKNYQYLY